jgi:hypothetical protein
MKNKIIIVSTILVVGFLCIGSYLFFYKRNISPAPVQIQDENIILAELDRLNIKTVGFLNQEQVEIPVKLDNADWGMKKEICSEGGYDLSSYAGKNVILTSYSTNQVYNKTNHLNVWTLTSENKIICVYRAVKSDYLTRPGPSLLVPGIFSTKPDPNITPN